MPRVSSSPDPLRAGAQWTQLYFGLALTALATFLLERSLTRILFVTFSADFAQSAVLVALLGLPVGGVFSLVITRRRTNLSAELGRLTFLNSVTLVLLLWFLVSLHGETSLSGFVVVALSCGAPFFFAGNVIAIAIQEGARRVHKAVSAAMLCMAGGCLLLIPFFRLFGGPNTLLTAAIVFGIASSIWFNRGGEGQLRALAALVALMLVALMGINGLNDVFKIRWAKGQQLNGETYSRWNTYSRVAVQNGGPGTGWVTVDGAIYQEFRQLPAAAGMEEGRFSFVSIYAAHPPGNALMVGAQSIQQAVAAAATGHRTTLVEPNRIIANDIAGDLLSVAAQSGSVSVDASSARSFLERLEATTDARYDWIYIGIPEEPELFHSVAAVLTEEGLARVADRLSDSGTLVIDASVWANLVPPLEETLFAHFGQAGEQVQFAELRRTAQDSAENVVLLVTRSPEVFDTVVASAIQEQASPDGYRIEIPGLPSMDAPPVFTDDVLLQLPARLSSANRDAPNVPFAVSAIPFGFLAAAVAFAVVVAIVAGQRMLLPAQAFMAGSRNILFLIAGGFGYGLAVAPVLTQWGLRSSNPTYAFSAGFLSLMCAAGAGAWIARWWPESAMRWFGTIVAGLTSLMLMSWLAGRGLLTVVPAALEWLVLAALAAPAGLLLGMVFVRGLIPLARSPLIRVAAAGFLAAIVTGWAGSILGGLLAGATVPILGGALLIGITVLGLGRGVMGSAPSS